ncbi:MAG: substrate-binding domain-containing protein, partial [Planctomycetota bacterium]|nr:substrate-binding domain-containing protein [Planctomycetota bacterium]
ADNLAGLINDACAKTHVVTHDSDAPGTQRRCFIGCDNYSAGRACGELVREALPDGGEIMIFVGGLGQDNAKRRRQGVIDELLGRDHDASRFDALGSPISGNGYTIVDTRTDGGDNAKAKSNAEDALVAHPGLDCMVGLFAYNPPAILAAVKAAEKQEDIAIIGFDEHRSTVQAIKAGEIHGTVSQQPYYYGYESIRILKALHDGDESVLPADGILKVDYKVYRQDNAQELLDLLDDVLGK